MSDNNVLLARQPIYHSDMTIAAYELLFRPEEGEDLNKFDGNIATSRVLLNAFTEYDLDAVTEGKPAFINFTKDLFFSPPPFDPKRIVIEILEDIEVTESLIAQTKYLKQKNFEIALDDFVMDERYKPLIPLANYIKLELPAMDEETLRSTINYFKPYPCTLLAEKVETQTDYRKCVDFGCTLFQGYFLSRPEIIKGRKLSPNKLAVLQLISEVQNPVIDIPGLIKVISRDTTLSFKLLKLVNSASYRRVKEISSIHMAVMMLGMSKIKSWASLLALSKLDDKPKAIQMSSVIRAGLCERLAKYFGDEFKDLFFTIGLLSTLDVFFDTPLSELVNDLPLTDDVAAALLNYKGKPGLALHTVKNYEISHWKAIHWDILGRFGITRMELNKAYMETIKWANSQEF